MITFLYHLTVVYLILELPIGNQVNILKATEEKETKYGCTAKKQGRTPP